IKVVNPASISVRGLVPRSENPKKPPKSFSPLPNHPLYTTRYNPPAICIANIATRAATFRAPLLLRTGRAGRSPKGDTRRIRRGCAPVLVALCCERDFRGGGNGLVWGGTTMYAVDRQKPPRKEKFTSPVEVTYWKGGRRQSRSPNIPW